MARTWIVLVLALAGCGAGEDEGAEAGVGGDRTGCGLPGTNSVELGDYSCACIDGYAWCSDALDEFDCCPVDSHDRDPGTMAPELPCGGEQLEQLVCVPGPAGGDPTESRIWACNGEDWVLAPSYATFACAALGFPFAYGCEPAEPEPQFMCGYGPGSSCEVDSFAGICVDEDIIDTCVWGLRTVDRCSRLCAELEVWGSGFTSGACEQAGPDAPASCVCSP